MAAWSGAVGDDVNEHGADGGRFWPPVMFLRHKPPQHARLHPEEEEPLLAKQSPATAARRRRRSFMERLAASTALAADRGDHHGGEGGGHARRPGTPPPLGRGDRRGGEGGGRSSPRSISSSPTSPEQDEMSSSFAMTCSSFPASIWRWSAAYDGNTTGAQNLPPSASCSSPLPWTFSSFVFVSSRSALPTASSTPKISCKCEQDAGDGAAPTASLDAGNGAMAIPSARDGGSASVGLERCRGWVCAGGRT